MSRVNFDQLLEAGVHFGHLKRKWNPAMAPYIFMERNGIHMANVRTLYGYLSKSHRTLSICTIWLMFPEITRL